MHELGIVFYIIRDVKQAALEHSVQKVSGVVMNIGEVSTIIPDYLPAVTYCEDCHSEYGTVAHGKKCPCCGSEHTYLLRGNEVEIKEIEVPNE